MSFVRSICRTVLVGTLLVMLGSCDKDQPARARANTPLVAMQETIALIKAGDFASFWKHALPPGDYANLRADWSRSHSLQAPPSAEDQRRFEQSMAELSAKDADIKLYAKLSPQLTKFQQQYRDQLPMLISVLQEIANTGIEQSPQLNTQQKKHAHAVVAVLAPWAKQVNWFDQANAKKAIAIVTKTARNLELKTVDQLRALSFDQAMQKYSVGFHGAEELLSLYGVSVDDSLGSIKLSMLENTPSSARVRAEYQLLGNPLSTEFTLIKQDGRWYDRDLLQHEREEHRQLMSPAPAGSAPAMAAGQAAAIAGRSNAAPTRG